jgi:LuxR family transcriptional regulator, maltose regulon positive regulatory protein
MRLRAPRFKRDVVKRRRLLAQVAGDRDRPIVLVCAPAGFGKTILAAQLGAEDARPSGWIHLEDCDNDPVVLLSDVAQVLDGVNSVASRLTRELESPFPQIHDTILPLLQEDLAGRDPFLLVLDELAALSQPTAQEVIASLIEALPDGSRVVLTSRSEPELPSRDCAPLVRCSMCAGET